MDFRATFFRSALLEAVINKTGKPLLDNCPSSPSAQESVDGDTSCQGGIPRLVGIPGRRAGARFPYAMWLVVACCCYASGGSQGVSRRPFREAGGSDPTDLKGNGEITRACGSARRVSRRETAIFPMQCESENIRERK